MSAFEPFPKLTRFSHDWTISEKIDGSNAQINIVPEDTMSPNIKYGPAVAVLMHENVVYSVFAGSRNRLLDTSKTGDHAGFARFVADNARGFVETLGAGRHFGEWYGAGIQRNYGLTEKRFALFNPRWRGVELPDRVDVVPVLFEGYLSHAGVFDNALIDLSLAGSKLVPGFMNPEGIVMYHGPSKTLFKRTFDYDEQGKWAENQSRKETK
jgi:hypothetical protein